MDSCAFDEIIPFLSWSGFDPFRILVGARHAETGNHGGLSLPRETLRLTPLARPVSVTKWKSIWRSARTAINYF